MHTGPDSRPVDPPFSRTISYHEIALGALHNFGDAGDWKNLMDAGMKLMEAVSRQKLLVPAPVEFPFEQMLEALAHSEQSKQKTVIYLDYSD
ncbi:hypothetical protein [Persicobacter sp. CCB-QB2]|uniref:hypothetical protein n=1 Tax=Persicobacter sp. CCB-QB2 TaxID=1561025 RepID=UPI000A4D7AE0|nr:hypothetical protein [Persicobacter sp. CCB-QB2]